MNSDYDKFNIMDTKGRKWFRNHVVSRKQRKNRMPSEHVTIEGKERLIPHFPHPEYHIRWICPKQAMEAAKISLYRSLCNVIRTITARENLARIVSVVAFFAFRT
jgi:hypothetical protein